MGRLRTHKRRVTTAATGLGILAAILLASAVIGQTPQPVGVQGSWRLTFDDEFSGTTLDTQNWTAPAGNRLNGVTTDPAGVSVRNGTAIIRLLSATRGGEICTCDSPIDYRLPVGGYTEARIYFSGGSRDIYNWPAWWTSGPDWPVAGEHDIAEGLGGRLTVNYHSASGAHNQGAVPGTWGNNYHVYGLHRRATTADVYYDGVKVKSYPTDDDGRAHVLIVNIGTDSLRGGRVTGSAGQTRVDYVRAWEPVG